MHIPPSRSGLYWSALGESVCPVKWPKARGVSRPPTAPTLAGATPAGSFTNHAHHLVFAAQSTDRSTNLVELRLNARQTLHLRR